MPSPSKRIRTSTPLDEEDSHRELSAAKDGSSSLELMLGGYTVETFFEEIWQQKPCVTKCTTNVDIHEDTTSSCKLKGDALRALLSMQWDILADILERSRSLFHTLHDPAPVHLNLNGIDPPLFFQDQSPLQYEVIQELYSSNPLSAYLDGCSIVINHADLIHNLFASLCQDLQRIFPHIYVNTYLTPPNSCAVSAHADDRDVFVIQLLGSKQWQVYQAPILVRIYHHLNMY
jgi:ribosomal protein L16 Arg81 hydroxylase